MAEKQPIIPKRVSSKYFQAFVENILKRFFKRENLEDFFCLFSLASSSSFFSLPLGLVMFEEIDKSSKRHFSVITLHELLSNLCME